MSGNTRRRSKMLRLMLAAVALLGIGAAITAAAWEDHVHFRVDAEAATFDVQGRIASSVDDDETPAWHPGDYAGGWSDSEDPGDITLVASFTNLLPGDERDFYLQLRNEGSVTAYADTDASGVSWSGDQSCFTDDMDDTTRARIRVNGTPPLPLTIASETETDVYHLTLVVPADWSSDCQGEAESWTVAIRYTTEP